VVEQAVYNQACRDTQQLLAEIRPDSPIVLNDEGLPVQRFGAHKEIGPAYATNEAARAAAQDEYELRLANAPTEKARENVSFPHVLGVEIKDQQDNTVARWWEVSERGIAGEGHTEQKMVARIDFEVMRERGYTLDLVGDLAPCEMACRPADQSATLPCNDILHHFASTYDTGIVYKDYFDKIHAYGPAYEDLNV
jgi:hypothetical protein